MGQKRRRGSGDESGAPSSERKARKGTRERSSARLPERPRDTPNSWKDGTAPKSTAASLTSSKSDIDTIFAAAATKQRKEKKPAPRESAKAPQRQKEKATENEKNGDLFADVRGTSSAPRFTEDGLRIYTVEELGIREDSGNTKDCPFDCWCCF